MAADVRQLSFNNTNYEDGCVSARVGALYTHIPSCISGQETKINDFYKKISIHTDEQLH